ncbi:MAG: hypothetical protein LR008_01670 [Candidatus Pacebacteria bacterium]|nr:hypothetical protein [Candidatus Paceibacterota bacterium]
MSSKTSSDVISMSELRDIIQAKNERPYGFPYLHRTRKHIINENITELKAMTVNNKYSQTCYEVRRIMKESCMITSFGKTTEDTPIEGYGYNAFFCFYGVRKESNGKVLVRIYSHRFMDYLLEVLPKTSAKTQFEFDEMCKGFSALK